MKNYIIIIIILVVIGFVNSRSRDDYKYVLDNEHNLSVEVYKTGLIDDLNAAYITDSTSFRVYVGTFNERHNYFTYKIDGDKIYIEKVEHNLEKKKPENELRVTERKVLNLEKLKSERSFK